jgi:hypothetical protein
MNTVEIFLNIGKTIFSENPEGHRKSCFEYASSHSSDEAAEEAFIFTNAPDLFLTERLFQLKQQYYKTTARPIATGDVVVVNDECFLCLKDGWKKLIYD